MVRLSEKQLALVKDFYYRKNLCMREIAERTGTTLGGVTYFMRKHNLRRRNFSEINNLRFERKKASFEKCKICSVYLKELRVVGAMLYWGEGYKSEKGKIVDFTNSDPEMIFIFIYFLRNIYKLDEKKFRILLYCYSDQNVQELINFWSNLTKIPKNQFIKPYIRRDFKEGGRKMKYGMIHLRYIDKKLLLELKKLIKIYKSKFCVGTQVVNGGTL